MPSIRIDSDLDNHSDEVAVPAAARTGSAVPHMSKVFFDTIVYSEA